MAKEDFCFTYYDGDAARDKAHLNRLERGAYDDIISAQRKRGRLSLEDIKKVLSVDFERCFPALEWVLKKDGEAKFYIEWVETSIEKSREHSKKQKERIDKYWTSKKSLNGTSAEIPRNNHGINPVIPLEDGDGYEEEENRIKDEGVGEGLIVPQMIAEFKTENPKYPISLKTDSSACREIAQKIKDWENHPGTIITNAEKIKLRWGEIVRHIRMDKHLSRYSLTQINKHFQSIIQSFSNAGHTVKKSGFTEKAREWVNAGTTGH